MDHAGALRPAEPVVPGAAVSRSAASRNRRVRLLALGVLALLALGELRLRTAPVVPSGLDPDAQTFARAALVHGETILSYSERGWLRSIRVVSVERVAGSGSGECRICGLADIGARCSGHYSAIVRYYALTNVPYAQAAVSCGGSRRTVLFVP
jgi:hypothetical protein